MITICLPCILIGTWQGFLFYIFAKSVNWEENRELGVVRLHIFNSRKIPGSNKRELGGHTVVLV